MKKKSDDKTSNLQSQIETERERLNNDIREFVALTKRIELIGDRMEERRKTIARTSEALRLYLKELNK